MAYLTTALDLKLDALSLAGEPDSGSEYEPVVYEWLTEVQRKLISGGPVGPAQFQPAEWYWARAWPRGVIQLTQPYNADGAFAATFTTGFSTVAVNLLDPAAALPNLAGYRLLRPDVPARHLIASVANIFNAVKTITLQDRWTGPSDTTQDWLAYPDTYFLPEDFVRGCSPLFCYSFPSNLPAQQVIDVVDPVDLERSYPQNFPWGGETAGVGLPVLAARVAQNRLRFSHFLNTPDDPLPVQLEFEYIRRPTVLAEGAVPIIPVEHRRILSYGVAALILTDKDDSSAQTLWGQFAAQYKALRDEHARDMRRMASRWGVIQPPRTSGARAIRLTESGLPVYAW
jgi:hypothetical protein